MDVYELLMALVGVMGCLNIDLGYGSVRGCVYQIIWDFNDV